MNVTPRPLGFAAGELNGLSERLIASHHANNYTGAVKRLNDIRAQLATLDVASAPGFQLNGLKREELVATNSMLLHELYFGSLGGDGRAMVPAMTLALQYGDRSDDPTRCIEIVSSKVGVVLLVLGCMHFLNLYIFSKLRKRAVLERVAPPVQPSEYLVRGVRPPEAARVH